MKNSKKKSNKPKQEIEEEEEQMPGYQKANGGYYSGNQFLKEVDNGKI